MMIVGLLFAVFRFQCAHANEYAEKTQYLGVINGQVVGNSMVKVIRTPTDPVLYRNGDDSLPIQLRIRDAEIRQASGGMAYITVKHILPDNKEARITLKTTLVVDGKKSEISAHQQGVDVLIMVPEAQNQVELRSDEPAELEVPVNYRGNIQMVLQVEDVK
ncbi:fimbrial protein [Escherichia coli]|nr:DUF5462 family protein [Escherichia coli]EFO0452389.1 fimbrial protein [Escherichia coli]EFO2305750.1 fimbrial protein [Escherichia coli]EFT2923646.1 DUF5462 family protein [Escherichia coli]EGH1135716.1 fimbrial protein [Escherichia coli]EIU0511586.1 DUF5462 family protein [Escherichia coli]